MKSKPKKDKVVHHYRAEAHFHRKCNQKRIKRFWPNDYNSDEECIEAAKTWLKQFLKRSDLTDYMVLDGNSGIFMYPLEGGDKEMEEEILNILIETLNETETA